MEPEDPKSRFQPIPPRDKFNSIATWHPCTFSSKIYPLVELAENQDLGPQASYNITAQLVSLDPVSHKAKKI